MTIPFAQARAARRPRRSRHAVSACSPLIDSEAERVTGGKGMVIRAYLAAVTIGRPADDLLKSCRAPAGDVRHAELWTSPGNAGVDAG